MHCFFPFPPFSDVHRPDKTLGMVLFLTLAEELEFQETRRRELEKSEYEKGTSVPPSLERQK